jgi:hypothetical protein
MDLIAANDAVDFLSKSAPTPWIKRMLLWMIVSEELQAFFRQGRSEATTPAFVVIGKLTSDFATRQERDAYIAENFEPEMATKLSRATDANEVGEIILEWGKDDEPREVPPGCFYYANSIDWKLGELSSIVYMNDRHKPELFGDDDELLSSNFSMATITIRLSGLCFVQERIELLQPHISMKESASPRLETDGAARRGRPRVWDWDGATMHLLTIAQTPDGLPTGPGGQAEIERALADWFVKATGNSPSASQIRQHAAKIVQTIKTSEKR